MDSPFPYEYVAGAMPSLVRINTTFKWVDASQLDESQTIELKEQVYDSEEYQNLMRSSWESTFFVCVELFVC